MLFKVDRIKKSFTQVSGQKRLKSNLYCVDFFTTLAEVSVNIDEVDLHIELSFV